MKSAIFCLLIIFYTCQADLSVEEHEREKSKGHYNISNGMSQELLNSEYPTLIKAEIKTRSLLDEVRLKGVTARKEGKDPKECIHQFTKYLLALFDDFFNELDKCNVNTDSDVRVTNTKEASFCNQKVFSAFGSVINGAREYFESCIISTPITSP